MKPERPASTDRRGRTAPPHPLGLTLSGLPELDLFESPEQREQALREIGKEAGRPWQSSFWVGVAAVALTVAAAAIVARQLLALVPLPGWARDLLLLAFCAGVFLLVLRWLHRSAFRAALREKLLKAGVPVCRGCGYSLRGATLDAPRCPECGRALDERVRDLLRDARGAP